MFLKDTLHVCVWTGPVAHLLFWRWRMQEVILSGIHSTQFSLYLPSGQAVMLLQDCWGYRRAAPEPPQRCSLWPHAAATVRPCRLHLCPKSREYLCDFFLQHMPIFQYSTLHCSLSLWVCKLRRLRKPPCLLFPLSLSHDFLLKAQALFRQSVKFNILFKLNVLGWPNQMLAGWPQEWEPRYSVI